MGRVRLAKLAALGAVPPVVGLALLARQGAAVRRTALRLPEALSPDHDHVGAGGETINLYVIGDSVAAAVGLEDHTTSIAGRLGDLLAESGPVRRRVLATSGFNASETTAAIEGRLSDAQVVVVSIGVNDTKDLHSRRRWRRDLTALLDSVTEQAPDARVVLLGLPPMEKFPALPRALGLALGWRARVMDRVGREVAAGYPNVRRIELATDDFGALEGAFARDGFHPSDVSHGHFAQKIHALLAEPGVSGG